MKTTEFVNLSAFETIDKAEIHSLEINQDWDNQTTIIACEDGQIFINGQDVKIVKD